MTTKQTLIYLGLGFAIILAIIFGIYFYIHNNPANNGGSTQNGQTLTKEEQEELLKSITGTAPGTAPPGTGSTGIQTSPPTAPSPTPEDYTRYNSKTGRTK